jgi:phage baseplate assembly protein W
MSYELNKRVVRDTEEEFDNFAYGITSPTKGGNSMFQQTFDSFEAAKANLRNLLLTKKGERVMQPEFGTGLHSLLFEPMDSEFEVNIQRVITDSVRFWLPYITIDTIEVDMSSEMKDRHTANMKISFRVGSSLDLNEITFTVQE